MCPKCNRGRVPASFRAGQAGMGLPMALFVIVVLALIVAAVAEMERGGGEMTSLQIESQRAFFAAESGAQIALHQLLPPTGSGAACGANLYQHSFGTPGLAQCSVKVDCRADVAKGVTYYTLNSTGSCGSGVDYAQREIEVRAH